MKKQKFSEEESNPAQSEADMEQSDVEQTGAGGKRLSLIFRVSEILTPNGKLMQLHQPVWWSEMSNYWVTHTL